MPVTGARQLWLLRHAKTLQDPPPGGADRDRRLAPRGERDAAALGQRLTAAGSDGDEELAGLRLPPLVLSSNAARAVQTTEAVVAPWRPAPTVEYLESLYAASPREVVRQVTKVGEDNEAVMVVGHNPAAQSLVAALLADDDRHGRKKLRRRSFATCALAVYEIEVPWAELTLGAGRLLAFLSPPY